MSTVCLLVTIMIVYAWRKKAKGERVGRSDRLNGASRREELQTGALPPVPQPDWREHPAFYIGVPMGTVVLAWVHLSYLIWLSLRH
jgi:hypothetical protein